MLRYDPIKAEIDWRNAPHTKQAGNLTARHSFPHAQVRIELSKALSTLDCNSDSSILDIGCGAGEDLEYLVGSSKHITGIDVSDKAIKKFITKGYSGVVADAKALPFSDNSFDYGVCSALVHHLGGQGNIREYIAEFVRVINPGGYLVALEPNCYHISGMLMNIANTIKPGITGLVPHERALSPMFIKHAFMLAGLHNVTCIAASFSWNRYPLWLSKFISRHEDKIKYIKPFCHLGWFSLITGEKPTELKE